MTVTKTAGQKLTATLRKIGHIGPRTRSFRKYSFKSTVKEDVIETVISRAYDAIYWHGAYSDEVTEILRIGFAAICSWDKHVRGYRVDPSQHAYLESLSPWQVTALLGEMVDAGVTNVGQGERWFEDRRSSDVAAWRAKEASRYATA